MKDELANLRFIRLTTPHLIPRYLVEQIKSREYTVEAFYRFNEGDLMMPPGSDYVYNPMNHLYLLVDEHNQPSGFLWFVVDPLTQDINIQNFSIDPKLWNKGEAIALVRDFVLPVRDKAKLNNIYWITHHPKQAKKYGFAHTKATLMEYKGEDYEPRRQEAQGIEHRDADTRAETISRAGTESGDVPVGGAGLPAVSTAAEN